MTDLRRKTGLLIDDVAEMRSSVRIQLADAGLEKCDAARNVKEAIERIVANRYDLIVCDYNLGQGADGQQLLELVRRRNVLPLTTAFLIITGESGYEQVSTTAEFSPDDYLIKPFTAETLRSRLERIFDRKEALRPIYIHMGGKGDRNKALAACDPLLTEQPRYTMDILRLKGQLLLELQQVNEALALYKAVLDQRSTPWAEVGYARALAAGGHETEAREQLKQALESYPNYLAAYDSLANLLEKSDKAAAQQVVERALAVAPSTQRQRQLGGLALDNGDFTRAETAYRRACEKDRTGFFKSHDDYAGLARSCSEQGKVKEALAAAKDMSVHFTQTPDLFGRQAAIECQIQMKAGNPAAAAAALERARTIHQKSTLDPSTALELANACFASGDEAAAMTIIKAVAEDQHENDAVANRIRTVFAVAGRAAQAEAFLESTRSDMIKLNNEAVSLARSGEIDKAITMLEEAAGRMPNNAQISINAALSLLLLIQRNGMDVAILDRAKNYLDQALRVNPGHPRLPEVASFYRKLAPEGPVLNF